MGASAPLGRQGLAESITFLQGFFSFQSRKHMEIRYENGLSLHVSIKHVNTLIKLLNLMRFIPTSVFYTYNSFFGCFSECQINRENWD